MSSSTDSLSRHSYFIDNHLDDCDFYSMDQHRYIHSRSGKGRTKLETAKYTNKPDPCGHTRKITQKLVNAERKHKS